MSNPTESPLSAAVADALSGTADPNTGAIYNTIGASTYYTAAYQKEAIWNRAMALSNDLRVVKDGDSTFGVRGGMCRFGNQTLNFAGASCQSLTANSANYIYIAESGTLAVSTIGFPASINCVSLAVISVPASGIYSISNITDYRGAAAFSAVVGTEAVTAGSGSPNILTAYETKKVITNEGATARAYNTLPPASAGLSFEFVVKDSYGMRITAVGGETIRVAGSVSATGGYIQNATIGSAIRLVAVNTTEWIAVSYVGTWTIDS